MSEVSRGEFGQHLLPDVRHVELDDREPEHGSYGLWTWSWSCRYDEVSQRHDDQGILAPKRGPAIERPARIEVAEFLFDLRTPSLERRTPVSGLERVAFRVPSPEAQLTAVSVDDEDV